MSSIRLYHAKILTMEEDAEVFDGEVHIDGNRISYVGENNPELNKRKFTREIDCEGNLLMPGFKNAHTHSAMTFLRSYADDLPLQNWLNDRVFPMEAKLQKGDIEILSKVAVLEYLTSGITSNFDMYVDNYQHAKTSVQMGFRTVFCGELNNFTGSLARTREEYETLNKGDELVSFHLGVHAEYTTSRELLEGMAELAHEYKQPVYLHLAETKKEVEECKMRYGMSPVQFLDSIGLFDYGGGGFHGVWMDETDRNICREKKVSIVTNPSSNAKLASGIADLPALKKAGINLAIGTDGPASNNALDMFREMYLAAVLPKLKYEDAAVMDAADFLKMAVKSKYNIFISGGTGSGKTTFLNALSEFIDNDERVITIEDAAELQINHVKNLVRLEARDANIEGKNEVTIRDLIRASLRMRPDRIIVGEVRGKETLDMIQAIICTI